jgi:hypothetical protein
MENTTSTGSTSAEVSIRELSPATFKLIHEELVYAMLDEEMNPEYRFKLSNALVEFTSLKMEAAV